LTVIYSLWNVGLGKWIVTKNIFFCGISVSFRVLE
jgi:hypothetical protein